MEKIEAKDIIAEQNELLSYQNELGQPYSATHLIIIHGQLNSIFNHAVRFIAYSLIRRGSLSNGIRGMMFWTKEEYLKFADDMMDKP